MKLLTTKNNDCTRNVNGDIHLSTPLLRTAKCLQSLFMKKQNMKVSSYIVNLFLVAALALNSNNVFGQIYKETLNMKIPDTINLVNIYGKLTAYYEVYLTNFSLDTYKLKELIIIDNVNSSIYLNMQNNELKKNFSSVGPATKDTSLQILPGNSGVIYIELGEQTEIKEITHRITFEVVGKETLGKVSMQTSATKCFSQIQLVLGAPMKAEFGLRFMNLCGREDIEE